VKQKGQYGVLQVKAHRNFRRGGGREKEKRNEREGPPEIRRGPRGRIGEGKEPKAGEKGALGWAWGQGGTGACRTKEQPSNSGKTREKKKPGINLTGRKRGGVPSHNEKRTAGKEKKRRREVLLSKEKKPSGSNHEKKRMRVEQARDDLN